MTRRRASAAAGMMLGAAGFVAAARVDPMATAPTEPLSQRLAAIRDQLKLLADYL